MNLSREAGTSPSVHSAPVAHLDLDSPSGSSTLPAELDYRVFLSTHVGSCYKAQAFLHCAGMYFDLPPKWESITYSLLSAFETRAVTSSCKRVLHQQKQFLLLDALHVLPFVDRSSIGE